jgi:hypothetical protein
MLTTLINLPGYRMAMYLTRGWVGGMYVEGLGATHSHSITVALCKVTRELID